MLLYPSLHQRNVNLVELRGKSQDVANLVIEPPRE